MVTVDVNDLDPPRRPAVLDRLAREVGCRARLASLCAWAFTVAAAVWVPRMPSMPTNSTLTPGIRRAGHPAMTLSFLYWAFCRILQLIRLIGRSDTGLVLDVVMLRHEVTVLRRQVHRPALQSGDRAVMAGLARLLPPRRLGRFFVRPETLLR